MARLTAVRPFVASMLVGLALAGCGSNAPTGAPLQLVAVPTQGPAQIGGEMACPGALLEGTLVADEEFGLAVQGDPNFPPSVVAWPNGYVAADAEDGRRLLNGSAQVVARVGDRISAGGGFPPPQEWFHPCGEFTVTPGG